MRGQITCGFQYSNRGNTFFADSLVMGEGGRGTHIVHAVVIRLLKTHPRGEGATHFIRAISDKSTAFSYVATFCDSRMLSVPPSTSNLAVSGQPPSPRKLSPSFHNASLTHSYIYIYVSLFHIRGYFLIM